MNLATYQTEAICFTDLSRDPSTRLSIAGMGLSGEAAEVLDVVFHGGFDYRAHLEKEVGDVMWYVAEIASTCNIALAATPLPPAPKRATLQGHAVRLMVDAGGLTDYLKKVVGYGHDLDETLVVDRIGKVLHSVVDLLDVADIDAEVVLLANIAKLRRRYPNGFSAEASIHRAG